MDDQNKNLILATALSFLVILVWFVVFPPPEPELPLDAQEASELTPNATTGSLPSVTTETPATAASETETRTAALETAPRIEIETDRLSGSISLLGGRIDDLSL